MKYILIAMLPILAACETEQVVTKKDGHTYIWVPTKHFHGHYVHDEFCDKCVKEVKK